VPLNRSDVVAAIAEQTSLSKSDADAALTALQDLVVKSLSDGEAVKIPGFFNAERTERAARTGRNPRTGEEMQIPAGHSVKLTPGSVLKKAVSS
jgi:DNA-binding protein HU-beta